VLEKEKKIYINENQQNKKRLEIPRRNITGFSFQHKLRDVYLFFKVFKPQTPN
jgi:hypothetical protein